MMQCSLDSRTAFRFSILFAGILLAKGRRTVSSWFRAAGVRDDWDKFYESLQSVGKHPTSLMQPQLRTLVERIGSSPDQYLTNGIDDSPTKLPILADMYVRKVDIPPLNACLYDLPTPPVAGTHGRPRKYGVNKISLGT